MTAKTRRRALGLGAVAACAFLALAAWGAIAWMPQRADAPAVVPVVDDAGIVEWCADGLTAIAGGGCLGAPAKTDGKRTPLLVYVHGRYSPKTVSDELARQRRVARMGTARGFGVLALRGTQGECTQPELADTWCWPSNPRNADHGAAYVERFAPALQAAKAQLGDGPTVLLGFSNGAYFATLIATRGLFHFDAIAIAHGGPVPPTRAAGVTPPLLLLTADDDPSDGEMRQLDSELAREKWPHELVSREGTHELPEVDIDFALTFFDRALREPLPLKPPLQPPRPRREAGVDAEATPPEVIEDAEVAAAPAEASADTATAGGDPSTDDAETATP